MSGAPLRILIAGGYGTFGGRLALLLRDEPGLELLIAGRSLATAEAFCNANKGQSPMLACRFDRTGDVAAQLQSLRPDIIVDAAGPFQLYGDNPYGLVRAALALGISCLDLADGADFVRGIGQFDEEARARNICILSGVSSFPVLTCAVMRALLQPGDRPLRLEAGLAPSPHADLGLNVIRAIASYAGKSVSVTRNGRIENAFGLIESRDMAIATPGEIPLGRRRFSLVDIPDLTMLRDIWPDLRDVWAGVAMRPAWLQRILNLCAMGVRFRLMPSLQIFSPLMLRMRNLFASGEHRGGMAVRVEGVSATGEAFARSWHMTAEGDDGPYIPSMPAAIILQRWARGLVPRSGARAATHEVELEDYRDLFRVRAISEGFRDEKLDDRAPLYRRVLADRFHDLPASLQSLHDRRADKSVSGLAQIDRGRSLLSRLAAVIVGFPPAGRDVPVTVRFMRRGEAEVWQRDFAGKRFHSVQSAGRGRNSGLIEERFGPAVFGLAYEIRDGQGHLRVRNWRFLGIPMPLWLAPHSTAHEFEADGRFHFHVEISHPPTGLIVRYRGWLAGKETTGSRQA